jgi:hypothetical protein
MLKCYWMPYIGSEFGTRANLPVAKSSSTDMKRRYQICTEETDQLNARQMKKLQSLF